jgi:beta-galactosidase
MIRSSFNENWFFFRKGFPQPVGPFNLPHDAMRLEPRDPATKNTFNTGYFPGGIYHYTKHFFMPEEFSERQILFEFEGVYTNSEVFINGNRAGGYPTGYTNFYIEATPLLIFGQENKIEVIVRNHHEPNSRWYTGSGIYRNVKMLTSHHLVHIPPDEVKVVTREIGEKARIEVIIRLFNKAKKAHSVRVQTELLDGSGHQVAINRLETTIPVGDENLIIQALVVEQPLLWSVDSPNLYTCSVKVYAGDQIADEVIETFGIRTLELDPKYGLRINGETIKLRGGCIHHDNGVIGACTYEDAEERRVRILKKSGFNAIRSAHNPLSKAMLDACDRLGMLVMDELTDVWFRAKTMHDASEIFDDWWEADLEAMIAKDFNHPSVIMYSIGNEISETAIPEGIEINRRMAEKVRDLDPSRFVINCINGWYNYFTLLGQKWAPKNKEDLEKTAVREDPQKTSSTATNQTMNVMYKLLDLIVSLPGIDHSTRDAYAAVDVAGYNYASGRYERDVRKYPQRILCGSETFPPDIAKNWNLVKKHVQIIGDFCWTAWDYLGEAGLATWEYGINQSIYKPYPCIMADSSIIDLLGNRQTQSYIHEIVWGLRKDPFIAVQPVHREGQKVSKSVWRSTNAIPSWTWNGWEGKRAVVEVYADADRIELFCNERSLGVKALRGHQKYKAVFITTYQPGILTAVSYSKDGQIIGTTSLNSAGANLCLNVQVEVSKQVTDSARLAFLHISLADQAGVIQPLADRLITVDVQGAGGLIGFGSADPFTQESFIDHTHTSFQGRALAIVCTGLEEGNIHVAVSAEGCETCWLILDVVKTSRGVGLVVVDPVHFED